MSTQKIVKTIQENKTFSFILATLSIFLLVLGLGYFYTVNSPQYALYRLSEANINQDLENFKKYVDIESSIDYLTQKNISIMREELDTEDESDQEFIEGLIYNSFESETAKDALVFQIEDEVKEGKFLEENFDLYEAFNSGEMKDGEFRVKINKYSEEEASEVWLVFTNEKGGWKVTKFDLNWEEVRRTYRTSEHWSSYRKND